MTTYLFAFNPSIWSWPELDRDIRTLRRRGHFDTTWSCGRHRNIEPGSRAFMVRLGVPPKGVIGSGFTLSAPVPGAHWIAAKAAAGVPALYVKLRFDALFDTPLVTFDELAQPPFGRFRWGVRASGTRLPWTLADALEPRWEERVRAALAAAAPAKTTAAPAKTGARRR
jgi:5-methylcytosine-specific restriction protein A